MFQIRILFVRWQHFISPPASLTPLRLPFIPLWHSSVCCLVLSSSAQWQEQETSRCFKKNTPLLLERRHLEWLDGRADLISKKNIKRQGSREDFHNARLFSHDELCAQASVFFCAARTCFCVARKVFYLFLFSALVYFACRGGTIPERLKVNAGGESAAAEARGAAKTRPSR